jgi:antitoxin HicB
MTMDARRPLEYYLSLDYPFQAIADPDGGYVVVFPDLPGCMTVADDLNELATMAADAKVLWNETEYDRGGEIPLPSYPEEYSGKFNLRLPKSLHRRLAEGAARDDVSLNQYVVSLLSEGLAGSDVFLMLRTMGDVQEHVLKTLVELAARIDKLSSDRTSDRPDSASKSRKHAA